MYNETVIILRIFHTGNYKTKEATQASIMKNMEISTEMVTPKLSNLEAWYSQKLSQGTQCPYLELCSLFHRAHVATN